MNANDIISPEAELKSALDAFETCLVRPIVSGELSPGIDEVRKTWAECAVQVHFHTKHLHPRQYEAIAIQDSELLPRLEQLRADDAAIEEQREQIGQSVVRVVQHLPKFVPDEEKAQRHIKSLIDDGVAFAARVRKQIVAVQTWYIEAFNRDSGAVD